MNLTKAFKGKVLRRTVLLAGTAAVAASTLTGCVYEATDGGFSDIGSGDKVGTITSFGQQGIFCQTWEGTMATDSFTQRTVTDANGNKSTTSSNAFEFSVADSALVPQLQEARDAGARVDLHYDSYAVINKCAGKTNVIVSSIKILPPKA